MGETMRDENVVESHEENERLKSLYNEWMKADGVDLDDPKMKVLDPETVQERAFRREGSLVECAMVIETLRSQLESKYADGFRNGFQLGVSSTAKMFAEHPEALQYFKKDR